MAKKTENFIKIAPRDTQNCTSRKKGSCYFTKLPYMTLKKAA